MIDLLIKNGKTVDNNQVDLAIKDGKIKGFREKSDLSANKIIDLKKKLIFLLVG